MYQVHLENFNGPLDLLLYFIRRDEVDIYDIPISKITKEYIDNIDEIQHLSIPIAGEFVDMAATLMRIKSKMMLPVHKDEDDLMFEDPRTKLAQQLIEYQKYKELANKLDDLAIQRSQYIPRNQVMAVPDDPEDAGVYLQNISLYDLALYFKQAMESKPVIHSYELQREPISLDHQKAIILANFDKNGKLYFSRLMKKIETKLEAIVTFLAILELMRLSQIEIKQTKLFGEIILLLKSKDSISNS